MPGPQANAGSTARVVRIAHASDLHLPLPGQVPLRELLNKRAMGYTNLRLLRSRSHTLAACQALLADLVAAQPDLTILTGDLVSLALPMEFAQVDRVLRQAGLRPDSTLIVPGNHDRYTPRADRQDSFERGLAAWLPSGFVRRGGYPIVRRLGQLTICGLDTAVWRGPIRAAGLLPADQIARLTRHQPAPRTGSTLIAMHHPPWRLSGRWARHYRTGLVGLERLAPILAGQGAIVLHGHVHELDQRTLGQSLSFGVPSASNEASDRIRRLAWHEFSFSNGELVEAVAHRARPGTRDQTLRFEVERLWSAAGTEGFVSG